MPCRVMGRRVASSVAVAEPRGLSRRGGQRRPHLCLRMLKLDRPLDPVRKSHDALLLVATEELRLYGNRPVASRRSFGPMRSAHESWRARANDNVECYVVH